MKLVYSPQGKINECFADPEVPQGGTIREILGWEASVPPHGTATHEFQLLAFYGIGTTAEQILANVVDFFWVSTLPLKSGSYQHNLDLYILQDFPLGTYSCVTIIAEDFDGATITGIYDFKVDVNVLTVVKGLGAKIISTSFSSV